MQQGSYSFQVSWVRKSDAHILTVDQFSYINDDRFFVIPPDSDNAAAASGVVEDSAAYVESRPQLPRRRLLPADADDWTLHIRWLDELMNRSFKLFDVQATHLLRIASKNEILFSRYALPGDSGVYECQISTEPKMSRLVRLSVAGLIPLSDIQRHIHISDTRVSISSGDDVHANTGSSVVFKCEIQGTMGKPAYVFW